MKIRILLTTLGVAALTVMTINANGALLSPRAASNQLGTASGTATEPNLVAVTQGSGRRGERCKPRHCLPWHDGRCEGNSSLCGESHGSNAVLRQIGRSRQLIAAPSPGLSRCRYEHILWAVDGTFRRPSSQ